LTPEKNDRRFRSIRDCEEFSKVGVTRDDHESSIAGQVQDLKVGCGAESMVSDMRRTMTGPKE